MLEFLGIGAQKAGTTWLYEWLRSHPQVSFPGGKEVHFWDGMTARDEGWYRSLFESGEERLQGEITPAYGILTPATIRRIQAMSPTVRLIYLIRNPIERAWSSARMALASAVMELDEASDQWFLDHFRSRGSLQRGDYETCIRQWRSVFGAEQLLILRYEQIRSDPRGLLRACCSHLAIDQSWVDTLSDEALRQPVFAGTSASIRPTLLPALQEQYQPKVTSLAAYLEWNLDAWLEEPRIA